jgi:hypothetical protein
MGLVRLRSVSRIEDLDVDCFLRWPWNFIGLREDIS